MIFAADIPYVLLKVLLSVVGTLGMMCTLTKFRYPLKRVLAVLVVYLVWVGVVTAVILHLGGYRLLSLLFLLVISVPGIFITAYLAKDSPTQAIFNYMTQINFSLVLTMSIVLLTTALQGNQVVDLLLRAGAYTLLIGLEWRFLRNPFRRMADVVRRGWAALSVIPVAFCFLLCALGLYPSHYLDHPTHVLYIYCAVVVMLAVYFAVFQSMVHQYQVQMLIHDRDMLNMQIASLSAQTKAIGEAEEKIRILRHDMRHFVTAVDASLKVGAVEEARRGLSTFQTTLEKTKSIRYCENQVVNATLAAYQEKAKEGGVSFEICLAPLPEEKVDATAFAVMLSNALENAFCAVEQVPTGTRQVSLRSRIFNGQYVLEIVNPCENGVSFGEDGLPISTRGEGHGLGTRSILAFAKENDAVVTFDLIDGRFVMHMMFSLDELYQHEEVGP